MIKIIRTRHIETDRFFNFFVDYKDPDDYYSEYNAEMMTIFKDRIVWKNKKNFIKFSKLRLLGEVKEMIRQKNLQSFAKTPEIEIPVYEVDLKLNKLKEVSKRNTQAEINEAKPMTLKEMIRSNTPVDTSTLADKDFRDISNFNYDINENIKATKLEAEAKQKEMQEALAKQQEAIQKAQEAQQLAQEAQAIAQDVTTKPVEENKHD